MLGRKWFSIHSNELSEQTVMYVLINKRIYTDAEPGNDVNCGHCDAWQLCHSDVSRVRVRGSVGQGTLGYLGMMPWSQAASVNRKQSRHVITAGEHMICHMSNIFRHNVPLMLMQVISIKKVITTTIHLISKLNRNVLRYKHPYCLSGFNNQSNQIWFANDCWYQNWYSNKMPRLSVGNVNCRCFEVLQSFECRWGQVICLILFHEGVLLCADLIVTILCHVSWHGVMASHVTLCDMCPVMVSWSSGRSHCKQEADVYAWENINDTSSAGAHGSVYTTVRTGH